MYKRDYTLEEKANMWLDLRQIQNLMGRYVRSLMVKQEADIFERFWSRFEGDVCYGVNDGWYTGRDGVENYYKTLAENTAVRSRHMRELFPEFLGDRTDEAIQGVGQMTVDGLSVPVLEVSGLGTTAKGVWLFIGADHRLLPNGPYTFAESGYYAVDFTKENTEWKIWHMQRIVEAGGPQGKDWATEQPLPPVKEEFRALGAIQPPLPNRPMILREKFYAGRPAPEKLRYPEPFYDFQDTFSYGCEMEGFDRYASSEW